MKIVRNEVTDYLTANFTEDETLWDSGATYNYGDEVRWGHYIYKYAGNDGTNTELNPQDDINTNIVASWVRISPTNYYAMLDGATNTTTKVADEIVIELQDNNFDSFALLDLSAKSVNVELYDENDIVVFSKYFDLQNESEIVDFYSYCFSPFVFIPVVFTQIPIYANAKLKVTISHTEDIAECGRLVFGRSLYIGETGYGANLNLESYSRKVTDEFGNTELIHRGAVNLDSYEVEIPTSKIPMLRRKMVELDAVPILFVMDDSETSLLENLLTFGYWQNFTILIKNPIKSTISLTIKGLL